MLCACLSFLLRGHGWCGGLGKKGSKEDLVQKLIVFQQATRGHRIAMCPQELAVKAASEAKDSGYKAAPAKAVVEEEEEEDEDEDEEDEDEDEEEEDEDAEEASMF